MRLDILRPRLRLLPRSPLLRLLTSRRSTFAGALAQRADPERWGSVGRFVRFGADRLGGRTGPLEPSWRRLGLAHRLLPRPLAEPTFERARANTPPARSIAVTAVPTPPQSTPALTPRELVRWLERPAAPPRVRTRIVRTPVPAVRHAPPDTSFAALPQPPAPVVPAAPTARVPSRLPRVVSRLLRRAARVEAELPAGATPPAASEADAPTTAVRLEPSIGSPLAPGLRVLLERRLGFDPGPVRIHTGEAAGRAARALRAAAFTVERHVFFAPGRFEPHTPAGLELLAHELTHVRQQPPGRAFAAGELTTARELGLELEARRAGADGGVRPAGSGSAALVLAPPALTGTVAPAVALRAPEDAAPTEPAPGAPAPAAPADPRAIAEEVYRLITRKLRVERERVGVQQWL